MNDIITNNSERWLTQLPKHDIIITREGDFFFCDGKTYSDCTQEKIVNKLLDTFQLVIIFDFYVDGCVFGFVIQDEEYESKLIMQEYISQKAMSITVKNDDVFINSKTFKTILSILDEKISDACSDFIQLSLIKIFNCKMREFFKMKQLEKTTKEKRKSLYD